MSKLDNLVGKTFGRLTVLERAENGKWNAVRWKCRCDCGNISVVQAGHLRSGTIKSCGCLKKETQTKHGLCDISEYQCWKNMIQRCHNPNHPVFKYYGARGISVCDKWRNDFPNFYNDMKKKPSPKYTLERRDNNGNYCKENCCWATRKVQSSNHRGNHRVNLHGWDLTIAEWARFVGLQPHVIFGRLHLKWPLSKAIFKPVRKINR